MLGDPVDAAVYVRSVRPQVAINTVNDLPRLLRRRCAAEDTNDFRAWRSWVNAKPRMRRTSRNPGTAPHPPRPISQWLRSAFGHRHTTAMSICIIQYATLSSEPSTERLDPRPLAQSHRVSGADILMLRSPAAAFTKAARARPGDRRRDLIDDDPYTKGCIVCLVSRRECTYTS